MVSNSHFLVSFSVLTLRIDFVMYIKHLFGPLGLMYTLSEILFLMTGVFVNIVFVWVFLFLFFYLCFICFFLFILLVGGGGNLFFFKSWGVIYFVSEKWNDITWHTSWYVPLHIFFVASQMKPLQQIWPFSLKKISKYWRLDCFRLTNKSKL